MTSNLNNISIIDLDEVTSETNTELRPLFNQEFNKNFSEHDWTMYDVCTLYGITAEQYYEVWDRYDVISKSSPCDNALDAIDILVSNEILPVFVTARRSIGLDTERTMNWMEHYSLSAYPVHIIGHTGKGQFVKHNYQHKKVVAAYDDAPHNLFNIKEHISPTVLGLINRPHNQHLLDFDAHRFDTLYDGVIHLVTNR